MFFAPCIPRFFYGVKILVFGFIVLGVNAVFVACVDKIAPFIFYLINRLLVFFLGLVIFGVNAVFVAFIGKFTPGIWG